MNYRHSLLHNSPLLIFNLFTYLSKYSCIRSLKGWIIQLQIQLFELDIGQNASQFISSTNLEMGPCFANICFPVKRNKHVGRQNRKEKEKEKNLKSNFWSLHSFYGLLPASKSKGAMKRGRGVCGMYKVINLTFI